MNPMLQPARVALEAQLGPARLKLDELLEAAGEQQAVVDALQAALGQLQQAPKAIHPPSSAKPKRKAGHQSGRRCPSQADVLSAARDLLGDNGPLELEDFSGLIRSRLADDLGLSLSGFQLRFDAVLRGDELRVIGTRVHLPGPAPDEPPVSLPMNVIASPGEPESAVDESAVSDPRRLRGDANPLQSQTSCSA